MRNMNKIELVIVVYDEKWYYDLENLHAHRKLQKQNIKFHSMERRRKKVIECEKSEN